jgi:CotH kinase protein
MYLMTSTARSAFRRLAALASTMVFLAVVAAPAAAESPADWMYSPRTISEIDLTLPPSSYQELEEHPEDAYVPGTFSIAETDGEPGTAGPFTAPIEVGVRLKGGELGSLRTLDQKAAFKVKFDEFVEGQTFLGLKKLTLNNMVEDPSMVHEVAAYEAFQALGVPSPHTGFAFLRVNGESFGLHLNIETLDKIALEKRFGPFLSPPQHLYEGEYGADVTPAKFAELEVDEGKKKASEKGDLEALVAAVANPTPSFSAAVGPVADLDEMTRMWAAEKYSGQWDGYSGRTGEKQPNNYYLYSDPAGRFQMFPWGTDETWGEHIGFEAPGGALFNGCLADTASTCKGTYRGALTAALTTLNGLGLDDSVRCTAERLRPWQQLEAAEKSPDHPERVPFGAGQIAAAVTSTRDFIVDRPGELASFLGLPAPQAPPSQPCPPPTQRRDHEAPPAAVSTAAPAAGPAVAAPSAAAPLRLVRTRVGGRAVHLRVAASTAGEVVLYGWVGAGERHTNACAPMRLRASTAGTTEITCKLTDPALRRRAKHRLRLHLKVDFLPSSGTPQEIRSDLTLPRRQR